MGENMSKADFLARNELFRLIGRLSYTLTMGQKKVTGPASYFPSIEKKYGKPIEHWMKELKKVSKLAHMEQVAHLKEKFEMGHGHANAIVAVFRQMNGL
jgi:hypothetical protein